MRAKNHPLSALVRDKLRDLPVGETRKLARRDLGDSRNRLRRVLTGVCISLFGVARYSVRVRNDEVLVRHLAPGEANGQLSPLGPRAMSRMPGRLSDLTLRAVPD